MNAVFGRTFPNRPNIYDFIENLRQFEFSKADTSEHLIDGAENGRMKHEKDHKRNEKIIRLTKQLALCTISTKQFLNEISKDNEDSVSNDYSAESEDSEYDNDSDNSE